VKPVFSKARTEATFAAPAPRPQRHVVGFREDDLRDEAAQYLAPEALPSESAACDEQVDACSSLAATDQRRVLGVVRYQGGLDEPDFATLDRDEVEIGWAAALDRGRVAVNHILVGLALAPRPSEVWTLKPFVHQP